MSQQMINFGIDLGTTNSLLARFHEGHVELVKAPPLLKENVPSVVMFKKNSIVVGDKAKEWIAKRGARDVYSRFKRFMGTTEVFRVEALNRTITPIELSSHVLKEVRDVARARFGTAPEAAVITIPSSFDTNQSLATQQAGTMAGFKYVQLLQEPIAACLAYANGSGKGRMGTGKWLVYDLGGGTFDLALVECQEGELRILDHEGDNYLGGTDFDRAIVRQLFLPRVADALDLEDLDGAAADDSPYNKLYHQMLEAAERAKIDLTSSTSTDVDLELSVPGGETEEVSLSITRSDVEEITKQSIDGTIDMVREVLTRNTLKAQDVEFILMVGGSTYMPLVRSRVAERIGIPINTDIDPTTAVAMGAAFYAATKPVRNEVSTPMTTALVVVKLAHKAVTTEEEELLAGKAEGNLNDLTYRIRRQDGGYDSGTIALSKRFTADLPLVRNSFNTFSLDVMSENGQIMEDASKTFSISHGQTIAQGQPLPADISIEVDDFRSEGTRLSTVFEKNQILPLKRVVPMQSTTTLVKGDGSTGLLFNVYEGPADSLPAANKRIGVLKVTGAQVARDVPKGADVELVITMSEGRELSVNARFPFTDQEFERVFDKTDRDVHVDQLAAEIESLADEIAQELESASESGNYQAAAEMKKAREQLDALNDELLHVSDNESHKLKIDDQKRAIFQRLSMSQQPRKVAEKLADYQEELVQTGELVGENGNDKERQRYRELQAQQSIITGSTNLRRIEGATDDLKSLKYGILRRMPDHLIGILNYLDERRHTMHDETQAGALFEAARRAAEQRNATELAPLISRLIELLPDHGDDQLDWPKVGVTLG